MGEGGKDTENRFPVPITFLFIASEPLGYKNVAPCQIHWPMVTGHSVAKESLARCTLSANSNLCQAPKYDVM